MSISTITPSTPGLFAGLIAWGRQELQTIDGKIVTLWDTIEPGIESEAESIVGQFLGSALAAVRQQAMLALSGSEKFSNAKDLVLEAVEAAGKSAGNTMIELLVNLALALFKAGTGAPLA
ncbi:MAG TPA: hypothetical protein VGF97_15650 [Rhizomicrobium sp.]|jgi:hypothetical protein